MALIKTVQHKGITLGYHRIVSAVAYPDIAGGRIEAKIVSYKDKASRDASASNFLTKHTTLVFDKDHTEGKGEEQTTPFSSLDINGNLRAQAYTFALLLPTWEGATSDA